MPRLVGLPPGLALTRTEPRSSEFPHTSAARSGRVAAPAPRAGAKLAAVGSIADGPRPADAPRFLDLPADAAWMVVERSGAYDGTFEVRARGDAKPVFARSMSSKGAHLLARDEGYVLHDVPIPWSDVTSGRTGIYLHQRGEVLALAIEGWTTRSLVTSPSAPSNSLPRRPDFTRVETSRLSGDHTDASIQWGLTVDEPGVGAIDGAGRAVVVLPSGRMLVLAPDGNAEGEALAYVDAPIDPGATDLSIVPPYALVLYGGGDAGPIAAERGKSATASRLDARTPAGALAWRVSLPLLATQPPLDGDGRIYVVGKGVVALDLSGAVLWSHPEPALLRAAAFADGTLVVVDPSGLRIVAPDGSVRQSVPAPEPLTTYPAIARGGEVWVASAKTLYMFR